MTTSLTLPPGSRVSNSTATRTRSSGARRAVAGLPADAPRVGPYALSYAEGGDFPVIVESYGVHRCARVRPGYGELALFDAQDRLVGMRILDLSVSGMSLQGSLRQRLRLGSWLRGLRLMTREGEVLALDAKVVRRQPVGRETRVALELALGAEAHAALVRYVFQHHVAFAPRPRAARVTG